MAPLPSPSIAAEPLALRAAPWADYELIDSGGGRKLERYGPYRVVRPEAQCLWAPGLSAAEWEAADAVFEGGDEEEAGRWRFARPLPETFPLAWRGARFHGRFTAFRHLGVFPEQAANWEWLDARLSASGIATNLLNLFGYTGVSTLVAAARGAKVTHVDASKKAVGWARDNAALTELSSAPVRWICEDARKYVQREVRRGARYDGIILDPPKYGRGPAGEVWRLHEDLPALIAGCAALLSDHASFLLLNAYSERLSGLALAGLLADALERRGGRIDWGELALMEAGRERGAGLSFFARWSAP
ncbi:MAG: RsmD family RNA methyltransferase [Caulobacteraceae bacterium]